jgi:hypothetical protein
VSERKSAAINAPDYSCCFTGVHYDDMVDESVDSENQPPKYVRKRDRFALTQDKEEREAKRPRREDKNAIMISDNEIMEISSSSGVAEEQKEAPEAPLLEYFMAYMEKQSKRYSVVLTVAFSRGLI